VARGLRKPDGGGQVVPLALRSAGTMELGPGAPSASELCGGYFAAHSQKFHHTPLLFGMYFTPVTRSL
jgi:hypothetical protein